MALFLGNHDAQQRRWQDFWFYEESLQDYLNRPHVKTCVCGGINGEHRCLCPVGVAMAAAINTFESASDCARQHRAAGFIELADHWDKVAERKRKR